MYKFKLLLVSLLAVAGLAALAPSALAQTPDRASTNTLLPAGTVVVKTDMVVTGFNAAVARKNGYPDLQPQNVVGGACGSSYVFLNPLPRGLKIQTGFSVTVPAISYDWYVDTYGPTGFRKTWGGGLAFRTTWDGTANQTGLAPGSYSSIASGYALLSNGGICSSAHPTASLPVF